MPHWSLGRVVCDIIGATLPEKVVVTSGVARIWCQGHDDRGPEGASIDAPNAPSGVGYGEGCPLPSRLGGLGERYELPSGARQLWHFLHVLGHKTLLVARKIPI